MSDPQTATVRFERSHSIVVAAPPAVVLDYVSNPQSWREWMPATHDMDCPDRPLLAGESFDEKWGTSKGEVHLAWKVTDRVEGVRWVAEAMTDFIGPVVAVYTCEAVDGGCCYTRAIVNPARAKAPTDAMVARIDDEAAVCLANIKRNVEARHPA